MNKASGIVVMVAGICIGMLLWLVPSTERSVTAATTELPQSARPVNCTNVGAVCSFRSPRRSALVATSLKNFQEFCRAHKDNELLGKMLGDGKIVILTSGARVRVISLGKGYAEAVVTTDNRVPGRGLRGQPLGLTGAELVGHTVWLDITEWTKITDSRARN